ncbi:single-stranded DNA-binding protein [Eoetvoesiella caeni]
MQVYANLANEVIRRESKTTGKGYYEFRVAESQRGPDRQPTWYSVRVMKDEDPGLSKGDFVKITGKLKTDFYLSREGKPTGTLLILAFEAVKIAKTAASAATKETTEELEHAD